MTVKLAEKRDEAKVTGMPTKGIFLLVGHPKSGKSWLASNAPESLVVELEEGGGDRLPWGRIQEVIGDDALDTFNEVMELAMEDDSIKTIIIDTVDHLAKLLQDDIAKDAGVEYIGKPKPGVDSRALWGEFASRVHTLTDALKSSGKLVILVAHCKPPEKDSEGRVITPAGINVSGRGGAYIASMAEMIGFVGVRVLAGKAQHYLSFKSPSDLAIWRSRVDELHDREIILDKTNPWGSLEAAFGPVKKSKPVVTLPAKTKGGKK